VTTKPPAEIQTLIEAHIKDFNTQDNDLFQSVFDDSAIIIDGIAPYRWLNPSAPANWLALIFCGIYLYLLTFVGGGIDISQGNKQTPLVCLCISACTSAFARYPASPPSVAGCLTRNP